jgi:hypothetical protein
MYPTSYHDTTKTNEDIDQFDEQAKCQEEKILKYIRSNPGEWFTRYVIETMLYRNTRVPMTSVQRAITNLTMEGKLIKSPEASFMGGYGRKVHGWMAVMEVKQGKLF